ncbi:Uncharacterized protein Adt_06308 [Abeliophyllum distichum]|uniref:Uncharacterized protein n=1 Tax=Abeliophyllum distichum TaxID=126358 RepID=A0ABD1V6S8_9LAMI
MFERPVIDKNMDGVVEETNGVSSDGAAAEFYKLAEVLKEPLHRPGKKLKLNKKVEGKVMGSSERADEEKGKYCATGCEIHSPKTQGSVLITYQILRSCIRRELLVFFEITIGSLQIGDLRFWLGELLFCEDLGEIKTELYSGYRFGKEPRNGDRPTQSGGRGQEDSVPCGGLRATPLKGNFDFRICD